MSRRVRLSVAGIVAAYGVVVAIVNVRNGLLPTTFTRDWVLFGSGGDFPGDFGRNVFAGSIGLGVLLVLLAVAVAVTAGSSAARPIAAVAVVFGVVLVVLYDSSGNVLAAKPAVAAVFTAVGVFLLASPLADRSPPVAVAADRVPPSVS